MVGDQASGTPYPEPMQAFNPGEWSDFLAAVAAASAALAGLLFVGVPSVVTSEASSMPGSFSSRLHDDTQATGTMLISKHGEAGRPVGSRPVGLIATGL
jgi:hypothetical protein